MIIDIEQSNDAVKVSYADDKGKISMSSFNVATYTDNFGYFDYQICDKSDPDAEQTLKHYDGSSIKKVSSRKFDVEELREFLTKRIPASDRTKLYSFKTLNGYAVDIELDMRSTNDDIFPDPYIAKFPINTIQITAPNLSTVTITTDRRVNSSIDDILIEDMINDYFKDTKDVHEITSRILFRTIVVNTEVDLLHMFMSKVLDDLHFVFWWNGDKFDIPYISTRMTKLGMSMSSYSPTNSVSHRQGEKIDWWPKHRLTEDYLPVVGDYSWDIWPKLSMGLDWISNYMFNIGKVPYDGSFVDLLNGDHKIFLFYGAVDTILLQLIHQRRNYFSALETMANYCRIPIKDAWKTTAMGHALIWDDLYAENFVNASVYEKKEKTSYGGGYVKSPIDKFVEFPICSDFSALYPRIMISHGMSFENYLGRAKSTAEAKSAFDKGYYVSVKGNIYKNDKTYACKRVEEQLLNERGVYKHMFKDLKSTYLHNVEEEMLKRGLELDKKKLII